jgi:vacuolar-type H+-ATPase subunit B/Vma2
MHKVIEYKKRADDYRRRASQRTSAQEKEAEERMAAAWELLATTREKQLKEGTIQSALVRTQNEAIGRSPSSS